MVKNELFSEIKFLTLLSREFIEEFEYVKLFNNFHLLSVEIFIFLDTH